MPVKDQGINLEKYMFIPRTLIFLTHADKILLIKGNPNKRLWANKYNGLGGHFEPKENIFMAARRELLEETGLRANLSLVGTVVIDSGSNPGIILFVFTGESEQMPTISTDEGRAEWIRFSDLPNIPLVEDLETLIPVVKASSKNGTVFSALYEYSEDGRLHISFDQM